MKKFVITLALSICSSAAFANLPFIADSAVQTDYVTCYGSKYNVNTKSFDSADGKTREFKLIYTPVGSKINTYASAGVSELILRIFRGKTEKNILVELKISPINGNSTLWVDGALVDNDMSCHDTGLNE